MVNKFIECTVPMSNCNLRCDYCYVIQENRRDINTPSLVADMEKIEKAFAPDRWGGVCLINLCAYGETLLWKDLCPVLYKLLELGHYVNVTNNGTCSSVIDEILEFPESFLERLLFSFSLHYKELKNRKMLETFASNVKRVKDSKTSFVVQINWYDGYEPFREEILSYSKKNFEYYPQVALTRKEIYVRGQQKYEVYYNGSFSDYVAACEEFDSNLFKMTCDNFNCKRTEFCYAGENTYKLDLATGDLKRCYFEAPFYNIYEHVEEKIPGKAVGRRCGMEYCVNSSHFMSLGCIPAVSTPSYVELRDREHNWIKNTFYYALNGKFEVEDHEKRLLEYLHRLKVVIYGANKAANSIIHYLSVNGIRPYGVVVSDVENNPTMINDIRIEKYDANKFLRLKEEIIFLISAKTMKVATEIIASLEKEGMTNYLTYNELERYLYEV